MSYLAKERIEALAQFDAIVPNPERRREVAEYLEGLREQFQWPFVDADAQYKYLLLSTAIEIVKKDRGGRG